MIESLQIWFTETVTETKRKIVLQRFSNFQSRGSATASRNAASAPQGDGGVFINLKDQ